jgi:hypothetical protein
MAVLYAALAGAAWVGRRVRERRAEAALAANAPTGFPDASADPSGSRPDPNG